MTLEKIYEMGLINDNTKVFLRDSDFHVLSGNNIPDFTNYDFEIESFTWQDDDKIYIDLK